MKLDLTINGEPVAVEIDPSESLQSLLRRLGHTSVKKGCGTGDCGSCVVVVDRKAVKSCVMLAGQCKDREVLTVEGLGTPTEPHPLQKAFVESGAVQCGFCTPGMILAAHALLLENPTPTEADIKEALDGNLCRCTGYVKIIDAVKLAASRMKEGGR